MRFFIHKILVIICLYDADTGTMSVRCWCRAYVCTMLIQELCLYGVDAGSMSVRWWCRVYVCTMFVHVASRNDVYTHIVILKVSYKKQDLFTIRETWDQCLIRNRICLPFARPGITRRFFGEVSVVPHLSFLYRFFLPVDIISCSLDSPL